MVSDVQRKLDNNQYTIMQFSYKMCSKHVIQADVVHVGVS